MKAHKQTHGTCDKTIPNFFLEYMNKYGKEDKEKSLALGTAHTGLRSPKRFTNLPKITT